MILSFQKLKACAVFLLLALSFSANAQIYSSACSIDVQIPDNSCGVAPLEYDVAVTGAQGVQLGVDIVLASVSLIIVHPFDGDLEIYLRSPNGVTIPLSVANGSFGVNYGDPLDTTCSDVTTFSRDGIDGPITSGFPPFIGSFIPQGSLDAFNDSTDPNGTWKLIVCDGFAGDSGSLHFLSLQFAEPCENSTVNSISTTSNSAAISFVSANPNAAYTIQYGTQGFPFPGGAGWINDIMGTSVAGINTINIFGLSPLTSYDFYIFEDCGILQSGVSGPFTFTTNKINDICSGAITIGCGDVVIDSTNVGATTVNAPDSCGGISHNAAPGLWYVFQGNGMDITVSTCGLNDYDTRLGVFEGPCLDLTCIGGDEDFCAPQSQVNFTSELGKEYYIYVSGNTAQIGVFQLSVTCSANLVINEIDYAESGIDSAEFIEIKNIGTGTVNLNGVRVMLIDGTGGGAVPYDTIDLPAVNLAAGDYFVICGSTSQVDNCDLELLTAEWMRDGSPDAVALSVAGNLFDAVSYGGNTGAPYTEGSAVGLQGDSTVSNIGIARIPDGVDTDVNNVDFSMRCNSPGVSNTLQNSNCTIANDSCAHALVIQPALNIPFNNIGANTDGAADALCLFGGSNQIYSDLWYSFTPACDGIATFTTVGGTTYDTRLAVYDGSCAGAIIACDDDSSITIIQSSISWAVVSGTTYILRLGGFSTIAQDTGSFDLTLVEAIAPVITCGADRFKTTDPGACTAVVNPAATTASDNCSAVTLMNDFNSTDDALGTYPLDTTAVVWTATDASGNTATCTQLIIIADGENPEIICPPNEVLTTDSGVCSALVNVSSPVLADNCTLFGVSNDFNGTPSGTDTYTVGVTTVIWTVTDNSGNTNTCSHTITINDEEAPRITCPANLVIPNCGSVATIAVPVNSDNCLVSSLINDFNGTGDASGTYPLGVTTVTWSIADFSGNTASCSMTVTRTSPPTASITPDPAEVCALANLVLYGNPVIDSNTTATHSWSGPVVGATNRDSVIFNLGIAGTFGPVTYTVTDGSGCSASDVIFVTVHPNPRANIPFDVLELCEGEVRVINGTPSGGTTPYIHSWTGDTAMLSQPLTVPNPAFTASVFGNYALSYTVTDANNCAGKDSVSIIVNQNPTVSITPDPAEVCQGSVFMLNANLVAGGGAIISQAWTGNTIPLASTTNSITNFSTAVPGIFNLTFTATDNNLCPASDNIVVTVNPHPNASFTGLQAVYCENAVPDTLSGSPIGGFFSGPGVSSLTSSSPGSGTTVVTGINVSTQNAVVTGTALGGDVRLKSICLEIQHPNVSDLDITLESPSGKQVLLASALCGAGDDLDICIETGTGNNIDLAPCNPGAPALSGTYHAFTGENLDSLNDGTNPNGNWNLVILDNTPTDDGALVSWVLDFESLGKTVFTPDNAGAGTHTITYSYIDTNGCSGSQSQNITVHAKPNASAGNDVSICRGDSVTLTATGGTIFQWNTPATTASIRVAPFATTTYTVTVSNAAGCEEVADVTVAVNTPLVANFTGLDTAYCVSSGLDTLFGTPAGGTFTGVGITTVGGGTVTESYTGSTVVIPSDTTTEFFDTTSGIIGTALGVDVVLQSVCFSLQHTFVQDLVVELTSPGGQTVTLTTQPCGDFDDLDVCIQVGAGNSMDGAACSSTPPALSGIFTASSTAGHDLATINDGVTNPNGVWKLSVTDLVTGNDGNLSDFSLTFRTVGITTFNPVAAGIGPHTIVYSFPNGNGCTSVDSATTTIRTPPIVRISPDTSICRGGSVVLTATGGISYLWSTTSTANPITVSPFNTATFSVTATDGSGCQASDVTTVVVLPDAPIVATNDTSLCAGSSITLSATGAVSYTWSTGATLPFITVTPSILTTFIVNGIDTNGCAGSDTVVVDVDTIPVAVPGPNADICRGDTATITASGGSIYYWSDGLTLSVSGTRPALPFVNTVYSVTVEDGNGCSDTTAVTVTVHPVPIANIGGLATLYCNNNNPVTLTGSPIGGTFSGPAITGNVFEPATLTPGSYQIIYVYSDTFGCGDSDTVDVTIMNAPPVSFTGLAAEYCPDTIAHNLTGNPAGGVFSGPGISGGTSTFVSYFAGPGLHEIVYTYLATGVCPGRDTQTVFVNTLPDVRITGLDTNYCSADAPDTIGGLPTGGTFSGVHMNGNVFTPPLVVTGIPSVVYYDYVDTNGCLVVATKIATVYPNPSPVILNPGDLCTNDGLVLLRGSPTGGTFSGPGVNTDILVTAVAGAGTHTIDYTYTDVYGCSGDTSLALTIHGVGSASFTGLDSVYCANRPVSILTGTPPGGTFAGPGVGANLFDPGMAGTGGPYNVIYAYADSNNCVVTDTQSVTVINSPFAQIGGLSAFYCKYEGPVQINLFPAGGELTGPGLSNGTFSPNAAGVGTHVISYKTTNAEGCSEIATHLVVVDACVGINTPSSSASVSVYPNPSEGQFVVEINGNVEPQTVVRIYDIAGKMIDEQRIAEATRDYRKEFNLSTLAKGVYYLRVHFNDGVVVKKIVIE